jgi:two-component system sensor histidine kinase FlrB
LGDPLLGQRWLTVINRCFQPRNDDGLEVSLKDGRRLHIAISALNPGQLIVLTDLTETRALQQRLNHLQRLSTLGKMMATLAHQIRTPLASAMLYAENLSSPQLAVLRREQFQQKLVLRLRELEQQVNDMLLFARSGTAQAVQPLNLQQLLHTFSERSEAMLVSASAELQLCCDDAESLLLANPQSLCEALLNLLQNGIQATGPGGQIRLALQRHSTHQLTLLISDNGPGIAPELLPHIFEPFFTKKAGGSGLGLAVVQAVIQSHQGQIQYLLPAERPTGQLSGACFAITLPLMAPGANSKAAFKANQRQQETSHV